MQQQYADKYDNSDSGSESDDEADNAIEAGSPRKRQRIRAGCSRPFLPHAAGASAAVIAGPSAEASQKENKKASICTK